MSQFFYIHPENPQARLINQAVDIVRKGGVIVYPTDSGPDVPRFVRTVDLFIR